MRDFSTVDSPEDLGVTVPVPGASRRRHDPEAVAAVGDLAAETRTKSALRVYAYLLGETDTRPEPHHYLYVVEKTGLVARSTSSVSIVDHRHDDDRGWEYQEYHELRRVGMGKDPNGSGMVQRSDVLDAFQRPLLLAPSAWDDDLRDVYDRLHGLRGDGAGEAAARADGGASR